MDLRQLRHFLAVVEHGSILRAAEAIHLTQPALSRSIQSLEGELDLLLLERSRRGIEPTPQGLVLARHARRLMAQADEALAELKGLGRNESIRLAVGVGTHLTALVPPRVVAALLAKLPRLVVSVQDGNGEDLVAALRRGEIDVALCSWTPAAAELEFEEILASDLIVVCRATHPLARRRRVPLEELVHRRWAQAERPRAIDQVLRLAFAAAGLAQPEPVVRSTSLAFLRALLLEADLLSFVPAGFVDADLRARRLVRVRADLPAATVRVGVLRRHTDSPISPAVIAFVEALRRDLRAP
jgi:DNA-binding transcriptional LysR family regulator